MQETPDKCLLNYFSCGHIDVVPLLGSGLNCLQVINRFTVKLRCLFILMVRGSVIPQLFILLMVLVPIRHNGLYYTDSSSITLLFYVPRNNELHFIFYNLKQFCQLYTKF